MFLRALRLILLKKYDIIYIERKIKIKELKIMSGITAEGIVGIYKGIKVYKVTLPEYVNGRLYKDEDNIYLIDGELIYKNKVFAKYDGNYVTEYDVHERAEFYIIPKLKVDTRGVEFTSSIGTADRDTNLDSEVKTEDAVVSSTFKPEDVTDVLTSVYETDYFSSMTDIDAFLKANS